MALRAVTLAAEVAATAHACGPLATLASLLGWHLELWFVCASETCANVCLDGWCCACFWMSRVWLAHGACLDAAVTSVCDGANATALASLVPCVPEAASWVAASAA